MCGIGGIVRFDDQSPSEEVLGRMREALRERGPDESAHWVNGGVGLVHTRLSIIDLAGSHQPMVSPDSSQVLVFNGEILNFRRLRGSLSYPYSSSGDTEVILAAHRAHGDEAPIHLEGQFAYALHDTERRRTLLVRDRLGILPLYYHLGTSQLTFASSINALLAGLQAVPTLDQVALHDYLASRAVPSPRTLLKGVRKLRPGHLLEVDMTGRVEERAYWSPDRVGWERLGHAPAVDRLDSLLSSAVDDALLADVPVGAYLSGGVDSSLIVAKASANPRVGSLHTFCAVFADSPDDEGPVAERVSRLLGTNHHQVEVTPEDFAALWPRLSSSRGAPISEPSDIAVYKLARAAREYVKVILSGEGSDELFAGYPKHAFATSTRRAGLVPEPLRRGALLPLERRLPARARRVSIAMRALAEPSYEDRLRGWFAPFTASERRALTSVDGQFKAPSSMHPLKAMLRADLTTWLPDNLLERGDSMSMAASLELRPPFLNYDVVDFALALPPDLLIRKGVRKFLVKEVARRHLPADVVDRRKVGFRVPLETWFKTSLFDFARDHVLARDSVARTYFDEGAVRAVFDRHDRGTSDESMRIWTLASLEVWFAGMSESVSP